MRFQSKTWNKYRRVHTHFHETSLSFASYTPLMNKFSGSLPQTFAKSCVLTSLNLNGNWLEGPMPPSLVNYRHYKLVYVLFME
ncbi:hypothetical protein WN944_009569 [Citrus x changshan-huyou]|uniref:Uncharacterized protein n=1 Tax=Citrus x changshan-huyou TaxID=2935761 RepID=A0AAP0QZX0_9ROSI